MREDPGSFFRDEGGWRSLVAAKRKKPEGETGSQPEAGGNAGSEAGDDDEGEDSEAESEFEPDSEESESSAEYESDEEESSEEESGRSFVSWTAAMAEESLLVEEEEEEEDSDAASWDELERRAEQGKEVCENESCPRLTRV